MSNDVTLLRTTIRALRVAGFHAIVFGGWAEELHGLSDPRPHGDIDLLVVDADLGALDAFVRELVEIVAKRQTHKRAFTTSGVLVELFLVHTCDDRCVTTFWASSSYTWPDIGPVDIDDLPVASVAALTAYRRDHASINASRP